jgi:hypothetical protein
MTDKRIFKVYHEKGGYIQVFAKDNDDAIEKYWESMEGILGHIEGSCTCCKNPKVFPREKYLQPISVEDVTEKLGPFLL